MAWMDDPVKDRIRKGRIVHQSGRNATLRSSHIAIFERMLPARRMDQSIGMLSNYANHPKVLRLDCRLCPPH